MAREPASIRYKNPGAMWGNNAIARKWGATGNVSLNDGTGQGNTIAVFPTYVKGICAQLDLWRTSKHYKNKKFADAIRIWSGGNHVESYISFVLARVPGMTRNTVMDDTFWKSKMGVEFLKAQAWHEAGKKYPAPDSDFYEAQRIIFGLPSTDVKPKPEPKPNTAIQHGGVWAAITAGLTYVYNYAHDHFFAIAIFSVIAGLIVSSIISSKK